MIAFKPMTLQIEWDWVFERARPIRCDDSQGIVAYDHKGIAAVAVIDSINADSCNVHWAIDNPFVIRSGFMHEVCRHIFHTMGKERFFGSIPQSNKKSLKFAKHIGATTVATIPDGYATGVDYHVMRIDKDTCRWIQQENITEAA